MAEGTTVVDLYGGSGSTLIACEQLNRSCYMMELDPRYCDVIVKRYAECVGKDPSEFFLTDPIADVSANNREVLANAG